MNKGEKEALCTLHGKPPIMLTPMLVQYVVALCCLRRNPDAVDITIGDMVLDNAAGKKRDVDVTITLREPDGIVRAFKAYEVKREGEPLDVIAVEQLCMKLEDMPQITHRAIVSASGFTTAAIAKAVAHDVELYTLKPWTRPIGEQFPEFQSKLCADKLILFQSKLLVWVRPTVFLTVPTGPATFEYKCSDQLFSSDGTIHTMYPTAAAFIKMLIDKSQEVLWRLKPIQGLQTCPANTSALHSHTLQLREDEVYFKFDGDVRLIESATITGELEWQTHEQSPEFQILEQVPTGVVFASAAVFDYGSGDGKMAALTFSPNSREVGVHPVFQLSEKHKHAIRGLKLVSK
jgi:hypothetical protein